MSRTLPPLPTPPRFVVRLLARLYRLFAATLRFEALLPDGTVTPARDYPFGPEIFALSERDALAIAGITPEARFTFLVAHGRDGDWATTAATSLGARVVRGATGRGGARALTELIRSARAEADPLAIVVDGPLGPAGEAKPGAVVCAMKTGRPLRPLGVAARLGLRVPWSWSSIWLPLPFSRVVIVCGEPLPVPESAARPERAALSHELTARLAKARRRALEAVHT